MILDWLKKIFSPGKEETFTSGGKKLYVGNLNFKATPENLKELFSKYGDVQTANIVSDKFTHRSKGYGFIEMSTEAEARKALELSGEQFMGRSITVSQAKTQTPESETGSNAPRRRRRPGRGGEYGHGSHSE